MDKLHKCNIKQMGDNFVFVLAKDDAPEIPEDYRGLEFDLATQLDAVLVLESDNDGNITIESNNKTTRLLNIT